jgi:hypothetical protein
VLHAPASARAAYVAPARGVYVEPARTSAPALLASVIR